MGQKCYLRMLRIVCLLTILSIIAQVLFVYIHFKTTGLIDTLVDSSFERYLFMPTVLMPILQYVTVNMAAYFVLILLTWFLSCVITMKLKCNEMQGIGVSILIWCLVSINVYLANSYCYPHSFFALSINRIFLTSLFAVSFVILALIILGAFYYAFQSPFKRTLASFILFIAAFLSLSEALSYVPYKPNVSLGSTKPNIIIIGFDSLRPDFIDYFHGPALTPHLDAFLSSASVFNEAYTPLARTYPSWMTVLTGQYPMHTNARNNLVNHRLVHYKTTLAIQLQQQGYQTVYASDEKRFSNITKAEGFHDLVGPKMGLDDFILGGLGDFPVSNLLVNLSISKIILPFNFANRAAAVTYHPDNFLALIEDQLQHRSQKPLFLAVHFCLTHWPYIWSGDHFDSNTTSIQSYEQSIEAEDAQFGKLMQMLQKQKLLQHALVIVISDHGTALGLRGDQVINKLNYVGGLANIKKIPISRYHFAHPLSMDYQKDYGIDTTYGQGTSLLSLVQYRVLMALKGFGIEAQPKTYHARVSLLDITPTVLQLLKIASSVKFDGISLMPSLISNSSIPTRDLFFETGDKMSFIETDHIAVEKVIAARINAYEIEPETGNIYLNSNAEDALINAKQLGILQGNWLFVAFPSAMTASLQKQGNQFYIKNKLIQPFAVLVNRQTGKWGINYTPALSTHDQFITLSDKVMQFYSK